MPDYYILGILPLLAVLRLIFGPIVLWSDKIPGANGQNSFFLIHMARTPFQAAVFAQELWESPRALFRLIPGYSRKAEIFSHEIEVQAAELVYMVDAAIYRTEEVRKMKSAYKYLAALSEEEITQRMVAQSAKARAWVLDHIKVIVAAKTK